jgi:hypothetical protein
MCTLTFHGCKDIASKTAAAEETAILWRGYEAYIDVFIP